MSGRAALACGVVMALAAAAGAEPLGHPHILWLVAEDCTTTFGCYGDKVARTPAIDGLAERGVVFDRCFTQPVCAPSRFALATGLHPASCGPAHHMRAQGKVPAGLKPFPQLLREAGYFTTNAAKTDYNAPLDVAAMWDASDPRAHYDQRPDATRPFFAVFNLGVTHESCLFPEAGPRLAFPPTDPAALPLPAYQPDAPAIRADRARHYDCIALLDRQVAEHLAALAEAGLDDDTIVFFFADNGGVTTRSKRFLEASGSRVPLVVYFPPKWRHLAPAAAGTRVTDPVSFVDFSATVLALAGLPRQAGVHARPFAGPTDMIERREFAVVSRDRMDERYDMSRAVIDRRWLYIRHFRPDLPYVQPLAYQFRARGYQAWADAARAGHMPPAAAACWGAKAPEELYDLVADPDNVVNLAADPAHRDTLERMRAALRRHAVEIVDNGFVPEGSALEGYDASRAPGGPPIERVYDLAVRAAAGDPAHGAALVAALEDGCEPVRWWAAQGCTVLARRGRLPESDRLAMRGPLERALTDAAGPVRVAAAEAVAVLGRPATALPVLDAALADTTRPWTALQALNVLDRMGAAARPALPALKRAAVSLAGAADPDAARVGRDNTVAGYRLRLLDHAIGVLDGSVSPLVYVVPAP
jgi:arylsulfatase A-like enzyme